MAKNSYPIMSQRQQQLANALFCGIEASELPAVRTVLTEISGAILGPELDALLLEKLLRDVVGMFEEGFRDKLPIDTPYHNLEHTLQTTLCFAQLCLNWKLTGQTPEPSSTDFYNGLAAALLHDAGYMKDAGDHAGTGAKHTLGHELRSCEIAKDYLRALGWDTGRILTVCSIICCTGPLADFSTIDFPNAMARHLGQMVCTADYLGQIADPGYVHKIPALYEEFKESDQVRSIPVESRNYTSVDELLQGTNTFWRNFVEPRLREECGALCDLLANRETGTNAYLREVESNLKRIGTLDSANSS